MALGMTVVIITGGIDLSVGSVMGLVAIVAGLFLTWHYPWYVAFSMGMLAGLACGVVQRLFRRLCRHAVLRRDAWHAVDRALAGGGVFRQPDALPVRARRANRQGDRSGEVAAACACRLGAALDSGVLLAFLGDDRAGPDRRLCLQFTAWARHLFAIGGNEQAARLTGVPVDWIKFQAYVFSAFTASVASLLLLGYNGSAINAMGRATNCA